MGYTFSSGKRDPRVEIQIPRHCRMLPRRLTQFSLTGATVAGWGEWIFGAQPLGIRQTWRREAGLTVTGLQSWENTFLLAAVPGQRFQPAALRIYRAEPVADPTLK